MILCSAGCGKKPRLDVECNAFAGFEETLLTVCAAICKPLVLGSRRKAHTQRVFILRAGDPARGVGKLVRAVLHVHAAGAAGIHLRHGRRAVGVRDVEIAVYDFGAVGFPFAANGVLDTKHYGDELNRSWIFRTVGYGNNETYWKDLVSNLRLCGYDRVLSIEHEDSLMTIDEGLCKAVNFLKGICIFEEKPTTMSWA